MNIVFFGTPNYVTPILDMLHHEFKEPDDRSPLLAVVTQPPREAGRDKTLTYSAVDTWVFKKNERVKEKSRHIPILFDPEEVVRKKIPADIGILAAYGKILSKEVINYFSYGIVNIHPSQLPEFRGASPIQAAIATGKNQTGVTFMKMDEKMDHGPVISSFREDIELTDTLETLRNRVFERSAEVLKNLLPAYVKGKTKLHKQDHEKATYTKIITRDDGFIPWKHIKRAIGSDPHTNETNEGQTLVNKWKMPFVNFATHYSPQTIHNYIRALTPWPGVWTEIEISGKQHVKSKKRLKILESHLEKLSSNAYHLVPDIVQLEGKNEVTWQEFENAYTEVLE